MFPSQFIPGYLRGMCVSVCVESPQRQPVHLYSKRPCLPTQHNHHEFPDRISFRGSIRTREPVQRRRFRVQTIAYSLIMLKYGCAWAATKLEIKLRWKSFLHFGSRGPFGAVKHSRQNCLSAWPREPNLKRKHLRDFHLCMSSVRLEYE